MRARHTLAAVSCVLALAVSACGGSPEPQPLPKPTASTSPSESASPEPPVMPAAAKEKTKAGAIDFVRHYVQLINHAQSTGDVAPLESNEEPTCSSCQKANSVIRQLYEQGGSVEGGRFVVDQVGAIKLPDGDGYLVEAAIHFGPQQIDWPEPKPDQDLAGGKGPLNVEVNWDDSAWKVTRWTRGA